MIKDPFAKSLSDKQIKRNRNKAWSKLLELSKGICISWPPALCLSLGSDLNSQPGSPALAPNLYLPALAPDLYLRALAPNLCLPVLAPNLYLTALDPNLCLPALVPNLCLAVLALNFYLLALAPNLLFASLGKY